MLFKELYKAIHIYTLSLSELIGRTGKINIRLHTSVVGVQIYCNSNNNIKYPKACIIINSQKQETVTNIIFHFSHNLEVVIDASPTKYNTILTLLSSSCRMAQLFHYCPRAGFSDTAQRLKREKPASRGLQTSGHNRAHTSRRHVNLQSDRHGLSRAVLAALKVSQTHRIAAVGSAVRRSLPTLTGTILSTLTRARPTSRPL